MNIQPHLKITPADISPYVLMPGDPARVNLIGTYLENFKIISSNREFRVGIGNYKNKIITVCSTGIGCPSTAIATEELINVGARYLIRVGTCGGAWRQDIPAGSLIIPTASIRDEGTTKEYIPEGFPAMADVSIINALTEVAKRQNTNYFVGINRTHDGFYGTQSSITKWGNYLCDERWKKDDTPILSSEMESAVLFIIASLRDAKAGAIFAVNANPEPLLDRINEKTTAVATELNNDITEQTITKIIKVALEALCSLQN